MQKLNHLLLKKSDELCQTVAMNTYNILITTAKTAFAAQALNKPLPEDVKIHAVAKRITYETLLLFVDFLKESDGEVDRILSARRDICSCEVYETCPKCRGTDRDLSLKRKTGFDL